MCKPHWTEYTGALRKATIAREGKAVRAHNEAMEARTTPATGSLDASEAENLTSAVDAAIARDAAKTRRSRRPKAEPEAEVVAADDATPSAEA